MRFRSAAVLGLLVALSVAGCGGTKGDDDGVATAGGGTAKPSGSASAPANDADGSLKYSACMRANGVPNFPDANANGGLDIDLGKLGVSKEKMDAADQKCKQYLPNGGQPQKLDPEKLELARQYSKCIRANGVPGFPDPDPNGGIAIDGNKLGVDPLGATMKAAEKACQKYMGPGGGELSSKQG